MIELSDAESEAFDYFARRAALVPGVRFVAVTLDQGMHVYAGVERRRLETCGRLFQIQDEVRAEHPGLSSDFHIIYAGSRGAEDFVDADRAIIREFSTGATSVDEHGRGSTLKEPNIGRVRRVLWNVPRPIRADEVLPWLRDPNSESQLDK